MYQLVFTSVPRQVRCTSSWLYILESRKSDRTRSIPDPGTALYISDTAAPGRGVGVVAGWQGREGDRRELLLLEGDD
jgi:hypothetical protein